MKKLIFTIAVLLTLAVPALANCPAGTNRHCKLGVCWCE